MALVELSLPPLPAHVRTARLVVVAAARRAGLDDDLVDELRLAVGEAVSRAVGVQTGAGAPVRVGIDDAPGTLTVTVHDDGGAGAPQGVGPDQIRGRLLAGDATGGGAPDVEDLVDPEVSLAVLRGLVDDLDVRTVDGGTEVVLRWPLRVRL